jgi:quinolinate synthase
MAETAAILAPEKTVLLPERDAGCPMADMITAAELRAWQAKYPGRPVVCYVNTTAEVKAESDICCTSSNAERVVNSLPAGEVLFVPDKNLAAWVARRTEDHRLGRILLRPPSVQGLRHPDKKALHRTPSLGPPGMPPRGPRRRGQGPVHGRHGPGSPDDRPPDGHPGHGSGDHPPPEEENPAVDYFPAREMAFCANMNKTTLVKVMRALETGTCRITVPPGTADRARGAIVRMLAI